MSRKVEKLEANFVYLDFKENIWEIEAISSNLLFSPLLTKELWRDEITENERLMGEAIKGFHKTWLKSWKGKHVASYRVEYEYNKKRKKLIRDSEIILIDLNVEVLYTKYVDHGPWKYYQNSDGSDMRPKLREEYLKIFSREET